MIWGYQSAFVAVHLIKQGICLVVYQLDSRVLWQHLSLMSTGYDTSVNDWKCGRCQIDRSTWPHRSPFLFCRFVSCSRLTLRFRSQGVRYFSFFKAFQTSQQWSSPNLKPCVFLSFELLEGMELGFDRKTARFLRQSVSNDVGQMGGYNGYDAYEMSAKNSPVDWGISSKKPCCCHFVLHVFEICLPLALMSNGEVRQCDGFQFSFRHVAAI